MESNFVKSNTRNIYVGEIDPESSSKKEAKKQFQILYEEKVPYTTLLNKNSTFTTCK